VTTPGALPPPRSIRNPPTTPPSEMTAEEQAAFALATAATVVASSGEQKREITDAAVLMLVPLLRTLNPYDESQVERFAVQAAQVVEAARQEVAKVSWAAMQQYLRAYDVELTSDFHPVGRGRNTALEVAYRRVAGAYRRRMAAGTESIERLIAQAEEERFQALGGEQAAAERTGKTNAEIEKPSGSREASGGSQSSSTGGANRAGTSSRRGADDDDGDWSLDALSDDEVNEEPDDWDAEDAGERARRDAENAAADAAFDAEEELRRQARLTEAEREEMLEQMAQHEMEVRMERMLNDDTALASRQASQDAMKAGGVKKYRRVVHPELNQTGVSCGLCVVASTRIYNVEELLPIHNLCKCEVVPIFLGHDPGDQINKEDGLGVLYDEAGGSTDGRDLKKERYIVFDHPELGPVLRNAKHSLESVQFSQREASEDHKLRVKEQMDQYHRERAEKFGTTKK